MDLKKTATTLVALFAVVGLAALSAADTRVGPERDETDKDEYPGTTDVSVFNFAMSVDNEASA